MTTQQDSVDVEREAAFLCARLREFEREGVAEENFREWNGHVSPSLSRLEAILAALSLPITQRDEQGDQASDDERLIRSVIRGLLRPPANARSRRRPLWSAVMATFALGSTKAWELCTKHGFDPDREVKA